ncbi:MAG: FIG038648: MoaD and/or ThiS families [uncultured Thermomicrobiales bacterium]|uniref:FIG038648: MoaD and/or ThiS families n=1 Tax=uncultured Thermomicrobiales bacterium TaxID=1645740 RepID=A0A6J4VIA6_9BACT|nr:MAG: FIG038648: MoaD and/or ThiS families [uncultured Thermomicrobiales bacterium]
MTDGQTISVLVPTPLRRFTAGAARVDGTGTKVAELLDGLDARYPGLRKRICEGDGRIRRFVNVFVNGNNVREGDGEATPLRPGDEVGIIPAMAGGASGRRA